jgi:hypothetical protein
MHTFTEKVGIINSVIGYMQNADNKTALAAKNFDVAPHITRLLGELDSVNQLAPLQKKNEVAHIQATADLQKAACSAYNDASGVIDAMAGLLGKGTPAAQKLKDIRSKARRHNTNNNPTPASPVSASAAPAK